MEGFDDIAPLARVSSDYEITLQPTTPRCDGAVRSLARKTVQDHTPTEAPDSTGERYVASEIADM